MNYFKMQMMLKLLGLNLLYIPAADVTPYSAVKSTLGDGTTPNSTP